MKSKRWFSLAHVATAVVDLVTLGVSLGLLANRRRNPEIPAIPWPVGREAPFVQVIIPARNEESNIQALLFTLLKQDYPAHRWAIIVVDDGSTDSTAQIARELSSRAPNLTVVEAAEPPQGWTGKAHAMYVGSRSCRPEADWLLFVDADTRHHSLMLSSVLQHAQETRADLLSLVITVRTEGFWERVLVPQVGELYSLVVGTMDQVNSRSATAAANGQFLLVRREVFARTGPLPEVRGDVAEDRALAAVCKARGYAVRLEYGRQLVSARPYSSLRGMWNGYSKTLFWAARRNLPRSIAVASALAFYGFAPLVMLAQAGLGRSQRERLRALLLAALQLAPQLVLRAAVCRSVGVPARYAFTYPLAVAVGDAMLIFSAWRVRSGRGVTWKGRTYAHRDTGPSGKPDAQQANALQNSRESRMPDRRLGQGASATHLGN